MITINEDNPQYLEAKAYEDIKQSLVLSKNLATSLQKDVDNLRINVNNLNTNVNNLNTENNTLKNENVILKQKVANFESQIIPEWQKKADAIFKTGLDYVGMPYIFGEEYPKGFDCSSFTQRTFANNGITLLRASYQQFTQGVSVAFNDIRKGDLVFFKFYETDKATTHVGIADGKGNYLQTNEVGKPIRLIKMQTVGYVGAKRVIPN